MRKKRKKENQYSLQKQSRRSQPSSSVMAKTFLRKKRNDQGITTFTLRSGNNPFKDRIAETLVTFPSDSLGCLRDPSSSRNKSNSRTSFRRTVSNAICSISLPAKRPCSFCIRVRSSSTIFSAVAFRLVPFGSPEFNILCTTEGSRWNSRRWRSTRSNVSLSRIRTFLTRQQIAHNLWLATFSNVEEHSLWPENETKSLEVRRLRFSTKRSSYARGVVLNREERCADFGPEEETPGNLVHSGRGVERGGFEQYWAISRSTKPNLSSTPNAESDHCTPNLSFQVWLAERPNIVFRE